MCIIKMAYKGINHFKGLKCKHRITIIKLDTKLEEVRCRVIICTGHCLHSVGCYRSMSNADCEKMHIRRTVSLIIISCLEVAGRRI